MPYIPFPPNAGRSAGWMLRILFLYFWIISGLTIFMYPARMIKSILNFLSNLRSSLLNSAGDSNNFCERWIAGILYFFAVFNAPESELLLITKATCDEILPVLPAFIIAFKLEPLPDAKTHKFKPNSK